jgi:hypothetical protein
LERVDEPHLAFVRRHERPSRPFFLPTKDIRHRKVDLVISVLEVGPWNSRGSAVPSGGRFVLVHHHDALLSAPAKNSSAVFVFVCCFPSRSTPMLVRKARASAATWKASEGSAFVESSTI